MWSLSDRAFNANLGCTFMQSSRVAQKADEHVGSRIRQRRSMLGLTQEQLADSLGISYQQIQKYETGANRISAGRLFQIAWALDTAIGFFFEGLTANDAELPRPSDHLDNRLALELVSSFGGIESDSIRAALLDLLKSLSDRRAA
ncbi:MAG: helix-turn-helix transcriptional regulator [Pseudomonadota bacterium]